MYGKWRRVEANPGRLERLSEGYYLVAFEIAKFSRMEEIKWTNKILVMK